MNNPKNIQSFTLLEVSRSIQKTLGARYTSAFWVKAEMNKLNFYTHSGHCYPDLVEKVDGKVVAQMRSTLWRDDYLRCNRSFIQLTKEPLKDGIKILFLAKIHFDPAYGLSLRIMDIDPSFTLGDIEREKQEAIAELQRNGLFNANRLKSLPLIPQRLAVISVETSKGYADFEKVLLTNPWKYFFQIHLYPSLLQGDRAVSSVMHQLNQIRKRLDDYDAVCIIRGGGGEVGLSCFNHIKMAKAVAEFPIPVLTGIGHATNETVVEMIAFGNHITPTKVAEFLIQKFHDVSVPLQNISALLTQRTEQLIKSEKQDVSYLTRNLISASQHLLSTHKHQLSDFSKQFKHQLPELLNTEKRNLSELRVSLQHSSHKHLDSAKSQLSTVINDLGKDIKSRMKLEQIQVDHLKNHIKNLSPVSILKRGYSLTLIDGKPINDVNNLSEGDIIETQLSSGSIISNIIQLKQKTEDNDEENPKLHRSI